MPIVNEPYHTGFLAGLAAAKFPHFERYPVEPQDVPVLSGEGDILFADGYRAGIASAVDL